jgi:hypothetical protein
VTDSYLLLMLKRPVPGVYAPEKGSLHPEGRIWKRDDGSTYNTRGVSMFSLPGRMFRGEDVQPQIDWMHANNFNSPRHFLDWFPETPGHVNPDGTPGAPWVKWNGSNLPFDDKEYVYFLADTFFPRMKAEGFRCELVPITEYQRPFEQMRRIVAQVYEAAGIDRFHRVEVVNEPWNAGIDVAALVRGIDRHGVISAYGIPPPGDNAGYHLPPHLDYLTWRSQRDAAHYFRSSKDSQEMWGLNLPIENDEPCGAADYSHEGAGARNNSVVDHIGHHAIGRLFGGTTFHCQCGLEGRAPADDEPITADIARAVGEVFAAIPENCYTGAYSRNGLSNFPLVVTAQDAPDSLHPGTAYASLHGDIGYVVIPRCRADYEPKVVNGWGSARKTGPAEGFIFEVHR